MAMKEINLGRVLAENRRRCGIDVYKRQALFPHRRAVHPVKVILQAQRCLLYTSFRLLSGAGIRPPRAMKSSADSVCTGTMGARPKRPPTSTHSPTPLPGTCLLYTSRCV